MLTYNVEGYKRNKFYLSKIVKQYSPLFLFLQEHWLSNHECHKIANDFQDYCFLSTSSDMFTPIEDLILQSGPVWHGTAIGWKKIY